MKKVSPGVILVALMLLTKCVTSPATAATMDCDKTRDNVLSCLACNIFHEARGQSIRDQTMVAYVTIERALSKQYPDSICEVVWQPHQFSWTDDGKSDKIRNKKAFEVASLIAAKMYLYMIIHDPSRIPENTIPKKIINADYAVLWYHNKKVHPAWAKSSARVLTTDGHIYYDAVKHK